MGSCIAVFVSARRTEGERSVPGGTGEESTTFDDGTMPQQQARVVQGVGGRGQRGARAPPTEVAPPRHDTHGSGAHRLRPPTWSPRPRSPTWWSRTPWSRPRSSRRSSSPPWSSSPSPRCRAHRRRPRPSPCSRPRICHPPARCRAKIPLSPSPLWCRSSCPPRTRPRRRPRHPHWYVLPSAPQTVPPPTNPKPQAS